MNSRLKFISSLRPLIRKEPFGNTPVKNLAGLSNSNSMRRFFHDSGSLTVLRKYTVCAESSPMTSNVPSFTFFLTPLPGCSAIQPSTNGIIHFDGLETGSLFSESRGSRAPHRRASDSSQSDGERSGFSTGATKIRHCIGSSSKPGIVNEPSAFRRSWRSG